MLALPLIWRIVAVLAALAALLGGAIYAAHDFEAVGAAKTQAAQADQHAKDIETARALDQAITFKRQEADDVHSTMVARDAADAGGAADSAQRLLQRVRAADAGCVPHDSAAASLGASAASGAGRDMRADLLGVVVEAARRAAGRADRNATAGNQAATDYDALTP